MLDSKAVHKKFETLSFVFRFDIEKQFEYYTSLLSARAILHNTRAKDDGGRNK